jgi:Flp pilus assembly protein CpaB
VGAVDVATLGARGDVREASTLAVDGGICTVALRTAEDPRDDDLSTITNENERQSRSKEKRKSW